ncbi:PREDICTED: uncharacterized protein LOC109127016 [Camelina sativa]|uniref:Uncharacterized protein LOC109127016 n=1 Tax=Camelina sativa TaxID=90675 RepID=A0ABM1QIM9_CAMSA|nr:PREDICTED: uncharacterized protein LOC109127016 [Camelina sativa]
MQKQPYPHRPASNSGNENARDSTVDPSIGDLSNKIAGWIKERLNLLRQAASSNENQNARDGVDPSNGDRGNKLSRWIKKRLSSLKPASYNGNQNARDDGTFWTMCNRCKAQGKYMRDDCLDKAILCPHCDHPFIASEISPEASPQNTSGSTYLKRFSPSSVSFHLSCCKVQVL